MMDQAQKGKMKKRFEVQILLPGAFSLYSLWVLNSLVSWIFQQGV